MLGFAWVAIWLAVTRGGHRVLFAGRSAAKPATGDDLIEAGSPGLAGLAKAAFGGVLLASVLVALSAMWSGLPAIWWGVALLMVGLLLAALVVPLHALKGADWARSLGEVVRLRRFWVLVVVSISINVCWHFLINWLPTYLKEDRELAGLVALVRRLQGSLHLKGDPKYMASGMLVIVPFLAADLGNLGGGVLARVLANRAGMSPARARATVMGLCTLLITCGAWVGVVRSDTVVIVLIGLMAMATAAFMANYFAFTQEVSARHTGPDRGHPRRAGEPLRRGVPPGRRPCQGQLRELRPGLRDRRAPAVRRPGGAAAGLGLGCAAGRVRNRARRDPGDLARSAPSPVAGAPAPFSLPSRNGHGRPCRPHG